MAVSYNGGVQHVPINMFQVAVALKIKSKLLRDFSRRPDFKHVETEHARLCTSGV